jgi:hypothetical protein
MAVLLSCKAHPVHFVDFLHLIIYIYFLLLVWTHCCCQIVKLCMVTFLFPATASLSMIHVIQFHCVGVSLCDRVALLLSRELLPLRLSIKEFLGHSIFSAWVRPPGDARQIARELVSCDSSVCMGLPIKGPTFDRACLHMRCGYLEIMSSLVR